MKKKKKNDHLWMTRIEKDDEFGKWIFGSFTRYFLYLFMHYFLFIDYTGDFGGVRDHFQKAFGLKLSSYLWS